MKQDLEARVELNGSCYDNIILSVTEVWPREALGDIIGKKYKNRFILTNAYPIQTAKRTPTHTFYGNNSARRRLRRINKARNKRGGLDNSIIGQYHSHPGENEVTYVDKTDIDFSLDEMEELGRSTLIEILLNVRIRHYQTRHEIGEYIKEYSRRLRVLLVDDEFSGYDILIGAFLISQDGHIKQLKVCRS